MSDWIVGVVAVLVGALFCYRGYVTMRVIIPIWGAFTGFVLGAGLFAGDDGFLQSALSWLVGLGVGIVFGLVAYLYYEVSVALAMASIGFAIGASVLVALGITWSWLVVLAGVGVGVLLAVVAIVGDLPMLLLAALTAGAGASAIVAGIMLLTGTLDAAQITRSAELTEELNDDWWWYVIWLVAAVSGFVVQLRSGRRMAGSMRDSWASPSRR